MEEIKMKLDMWEIIAEIYEPVMKLREAREKYPEVFQGWFEVYLGGGYTRVNGTAIAPYEFEISKDGKWTDCTKRGLNISDRRTE
jgi:hypothetical protein